MLPRFSGRTAYPHRMSARICKRNAIPNRMLQQLSPEGISDPRKIAEAGAVIAMLAAGSKVTPATLPPSITAIVVAAPLAVAGAGLAILAEAAERKIGTTVAVMANLRQGKKELIT